MTPSVTVIATQIMLPLAVAAVAVVGQVQAGSVAKSATKAQIAGSQLAGQSLIAPLPGRGPASPARTATATATCATYAAEAGWVNNGYFGGDLVTAIAICVAESTGDPERYVCDEKGKVVGQGEYPVHCPAGTTSYDRGLWQLNSKAAAAVSDKCAFSPLCNAEQAYLHSQRGTSFAPWSSYDQDTYTHYLDPAQIVVTKLRSGTVTSAELGECLARSRSAAGAKVVLANCGIGPVSPQRWQLAGGKLRSGAWCAAIGSGSANPGVVLRRCSRSSGQVWLPFGRNELRNSADRKCLTDPHGTLTAGTALVAGRCANAKSQTWWLP